MIYTGSTISFQHDSKFLQAHQSHPRFSEIVDLCKAGDFSSAAELIDLKRVVTQAIQGTAAKLEGNQVTYKGKPIHGLLAQRILQLAREGFDAQPLLCFLDNLMDNPSNRAINELYGFLEASKLPITDDGHFLAYKSVNSDFKDHYTGKMDNSVGAVVEMPRNSVDEDKDRTCSHGLHFAAHEYASGFRANGKMIVLKINPRDVVAIPSDYNNQKGRCCRYEVVEEVAYSDTKLVDANVVISKKEYVPQVSNYMDSTLWTGDRDLLTFSGKACEFPVDRDVTYCLERINPNTKYYRGEFFFKNYDEANDNLVFARYGVDGEVERWVTISNTKDWFIQTEHFDPQMN